MGPISDGRLLKNVTHLWKTVNKRFMLWLFAQNSNEGSSTYYCVDRAIDTDNIEKDFEQIDISYLFSINIFTQRDVGI